MNANQQQPPDNKKFQELILFIAQLSEDDENYGATKLNKNLFYADFEAYRRFGKSITGQVYFRQPNGPCPRRLLPVVTRMRRARACHTVKVQYFSRTQDRLVALRDPDLSVFREEEIQLVKDIVQEHWDRNAREISDKSHGFIGWEAANHGENIPYELALLSQREPSEKEFCFAVELEGVAEEVLARHGGHE